LVCDVEFYDMLDPFQDGQAYKRMGFLMSKLQVFLKDGLSGKEAVDRCGQEYEEFLKLNDSPSQKARPAAVTIK